MNDGNAFDLIAGLEPLAIHCGQPWWRCNGFWYQHNRDNHIWIYV
jgi:hypothetical protein